MKKLTIAILAHPDDESFGMGGTLSLRVKEGHEVHVVNVTRGEAGGDPGIHETRELEAKAAAKAMGLTNHHFLDFIDGQLCNAQYHDIADAIAETVTTIIDGRDVELDVLTFERMGISGHLDHIAVSMITTYVYRRSISKMSNLINPRLLYLVTCNKSRPGPNDNYFVYGPGGVDPCDTDITVDVSDVLDQKIAAIKAHASQNPEYILSRGEELLSREYFQIYDGN